MAAGILFVVADKLAKLTFLNHSTAAASGIRWMETELRRVHGLLEEDPGLEMNSKALRKWVRELTDAAQSIEDIVDNLDLNRRRRRHQMGCVGSTFVAVKGKVARYRFDAKMVQMKEKMGHICDSMPEKQVFGFDKYFEALVKSLVEGNDPHTLYTFIVGPCGAGKTTLVKEVYNSDAVKNQFPHRFWFYEKSDKYWEKMFWRRIRAEVAGSWGSALSTEAVCEEISNALKGNKYLIVLDNISPRYGKNINRGDEFISLSVSHIRQAFPDERNGSRVVVTCSERKDADLFGQEIEVHELKMLSADDRWNLFSNTWDSEAAAAETTAGTSWSSSLLEKIVREQEYLPSEIVNLGALLSMEYEKRSSLSNIMLDHPNSYQVVGPLSEIASKFNLLDSHSKLCFLFCSLFPKGSEIPKRKLIWLWTAHRFKWPLGAYAVSKCLEKLSGLGMIQVEYTALHGYGSIEAWPHLYFHVKKIRLDSLEWDFAAMKAIQYDLFHHLNDKGSQDSSNARRLAFSSSGIYNHILNQDVSLPNLRFLLCFPKPHEISRGLTFPASRFKLLEALDLEDMYFITQLSEDIGELVRLKYLGLRRTGLSSLPKSIGKLKNLLSLDIRGTRVKQTPTAIQKLEGLGFLYMDMDDGSTGNDSLDVSSLWQLYVLSVIRVGRWMKNHLRKLVSLIKLGIYGDPLEYEHARQLTELEQLRFLRLGFGFGNLILEDVWPIDKLYILSLYLERPLQMLPGPDKFPRDLNRLFLKWSFLEQDPMPTLGQLNNLQVLKLRCGSFLGKKMVCSARRFPELRFLELSLLDGLEEWTVEEGAMPCLKHLVIRLCNRLKELPQGLQHLHGSMEKLEVAGMPDTFNARLQYNKGEDWDKIKQIKSVTVDGIPMGASSSSSYY